MNLKELPIERLKLGKLAPKYDPRTLQFAKYLKAELPAPPDQIDWTAGQTSFGMMLNDQLGDCTCAALGHAIQIWSLNIPGMGEQTVADNSILQCYENWAGYNPSDPSTDQGAVILDILNDWKATPIEKHGLLAFAQVNTQNLTHVKQAIQLFGVVDLGIALPVTAQSQVGQIWTGSPTSDPNTQPGSWGGHSVIVCSYTPDYIECVTWGGLQKIAYDFWAAYVDEAYALFGDVWIANTTSPSGFDQDQLNADLQDVQN